MGGRDRSERVCGTLAASNENDKLDFWWMDKSTSRMDGVGKIGEKWEQSDERDLARSGLADWSSWSVRTEQITPCNVLGIDSQVLAVSAGHLPSGL